MKTIKEFLTTEDILIQLAEEACELGQIANKMVRIRNGRNPSPMTEHECIKKLHEEIADVFVCIDLLTDVLVDMDAIGYVRFIKTLRWMMRLNGMEEKHAE